MIKVSKLISTILAVVLLFSMAIPVLGASAADLASDGTYTVDIEIQDEAGAEHDQRSGDFIKTAVLEVSGGAITANITVTSSARAFTFKGITDVSTAVTNDDGTKTYSVPVSNVTDRLAAQFGGGGDTRTIYVKFVIEGDQSGTDETSTIADGKYTIKTKTLNAEEDVEYAPKHEEVAVLTVTGGVIKAVVQANSADVLTFTGVQSRDITDGDVLTYELDIEDINEPVFVGYRERYTYRLVFLPETIAAYDESAIADDASSYVINATHTIKASFANDSVRGLALVGDALVEVSDQGIFVYVTVEGRALVGSEVVIENSDGTKVYKLEVNSNYDPVTVNFIAGGAASGSVATQILFDVSTLTAIASDDTNTSGNTDTNNNTGTSTTSTTTNSTTTTSTTTDTTTVAIPKTGDVSLSTAIILIIASLSGIAFTIKKKPLLNKN